MPDAAVKALGIKADQDVFSGAFWFQGGGTVEEPSLAYVQNCIRDLGAGERDAAPACLREEGDNK